jgi:hypothetical protein
MYVSGLFSSRQIKSVGFAASDLYRNFQTEIATQRPLHRVPAEQLKGFPEPKVAFPAAADRANCR